MTFGLAHMKQEGAPIHPDDVDCALTTEQYAKQLKAYNDFYGINPEETCAIRTQVIDSKGD